jgi:hypothetical protein
MKTLKLPLLILFVFLASSSLTSESCFAQKIIVKKTKGLSAIIESSVPLEEGQTYELHNENVSQDVDYKSTGFKSRQNSVSFGGSLLTLRNDQYQRNYLSLQARYGWNFTSLEFGIIAAGSSDDLGAGATTEFSMGGYFDYNLVANRDPKNLIYGALSAVTFGSKQFPSASGGGSTSITDANLGGFLTWFLNNTSTALRIEAFYDYQQISTATKQTNVMGFGSRALISFYF